MIEFALSTYLKSRPAIEAVVGDRVYGSRAPQTTDPKKTGARIVYRLAAGSVRHYHAEGASGLTEAEIVLGIVAETYVKARQLYDIVRDEIDGFRGTWDETEINRAVLSTPSDGSQDPTQGDDVGYPAVVATVEVFYRESIPSLGA